MTMVHRLAALLGTALMIAGLAGPSFASDPPSQDATVPTELGETVVLEWTGTVPPGAVDGPCPESGATTDTHEINLTVPEGTYDGDIQVQAVFSADPAAQTDAKIAVYAPDREEPVTQDQGFVDAAEAVLLQNPVAGTYTVSVCPFLNGPQGTYDGKLELSAVLPFQAPTEICEAPSPMVISEPKYIDETRAGGEPMIHTHPGGTLLYGSHAGTTHFYGPAAPDPQTAAFLENYNGQTYAYYSEDHGETWNFVDRTLPPSGVPNSGFSDPDFAIDEAGNVYLSEINLVNVAVSKSTDLGKSYVLQNFFGQTVTDRQWKEAGPEDVLFIVGNAFAGGTFPTEPVGNNGHTIYRSTDGGATFSEGIADAGGLGDIRYDQTNDILYEAHLSEGVLSMAAFRDPLNDDIPTALTPEIHPVAEGVSMLSHWPAFHLDPKGNLYITWDESGEGARPAGIWYAYSTDGGRSWADPIRVDPDDRTDIWPWLAVGDEGRVAVAWFGNDEAVENHNAEQATEPWNVYAAQTLDGVGCAEAETPGFSVVKATPEPFHVGTICQGGTICQAELVDRRLGDYFSVEIDNTGRLVAAYSDTRQGGSVALPAFFRQTGGPSFLASEDKPATAAPPDGGQAAPDASGDSGTMPATGGGFALAGIGLLSLAGIGSWAHRRRRT